MNYTITLPIPRPLLTTNQARSQHWRKAHRAKAETEMLVRAALVKASVNPIDHPITVTVTWYAPDLKRRDSDALDFTKKAILDAMVKAGTIRDDNWRWVRSSTTAVELDRDHPRIEIQITEATR
ncbi:RusA family crossover junction endodeoxyribonuclease [Gordonia sp. ABSL49_1]|uniref:RusA family crossover junction endodeoxyribonuclease n=1 Tax=Gordonia sp. ABSL49_1 TaxID=2920941 RepID=UPI001F0F4577|nr:RusA family crossover junction endodeoxyribonuclease [Gordonia sp. ABSL49_1]MCH5645138.1 RusA family crossover junction endodeoxyribonuclease [Gordonia sp. ABSL49_1]